MLKRETLIRMQIYHENRQDITIQKNVRTMHKFMINLTKRKTDVGFVHFDEHGNSPGENLCNFPQVFVLDLKDAKNWKDLT